MPAAEKNRVLVEDARSGAGWYTARSWRETNRVGLSIALGGENGVWETGLVGVRR